MIQQKTNGANCRESMGMSSGAGNGWWHGPEAELGTPRVRELDGIVRAHADRAAAIEGAELAIAVHAEHVRVDSQRGRKPAAWQLDVSLRADAFVLHRHRVLRVAFDPWRHSGLGDS